MRGFAASSVGLIIALGACASEEEPAAPVAATSTTTTTAVGTGAGGIGGAAVGGGGIGGAGGACVPDEDFTPTPTDINFSAMNQIPSGERILFNDWSVPDVLRSMAPDGTDVQEVFQAFRIWSMGANRAGTALAFASGDPLQSEHYCLDVGDSIQHTWLYDFQTQAAELLGAGNINDECHHFAPGDDDLYVCRRYDFSEDGQFSTFSGYRVGHFDRSEDTFVWDVEEAANTFTVTPVVTNDGNELWYTEIVLQGNSQSRRILKKALPDGAPTEVKADATLMAMSPDGASYVYQNGADGGAVYSDLLAGGAETKLTQARGTDAAYSPDGQQIAYLVDDDQQPCQHIEVTATNGSTLGTPGRLRDCTSAGDFVTALAWIVVP